MTSYKSIMYEQLNELFDLIDKELALLMFIVDIYSKLEVQLTVEPLSHFIDDVYIKPNLK